MKIQRLSPFHFPAPVLVLGLWFLPLPKIANAQNAVSMQQVQRVFARRARGNAFFNRNLHAALQARGLKFTSNRQNADAWLDTSGYGLKGGGFAGEMVFIGRGGKILRREKVVRPPGSRAMAFQTLARKMRFGKPNP